MWLSASNGEPNATHSTPPLPFQLMRQFLTAFGHSYSLQSPICIFALWTQIFSFELFVSLFRRPINCWLLRAIFPRSTQPPPLYLRYFLSTIRSNLVFYCGSRRRRLKPAERELKADYFRQVIAVLIMLNRFTTIGNGYKLTDLHD